MRLTQPSDENFIELMSWFSNEDELSIWSGPNFRYPFDLSSFKVSDHLGIRSPHLSQI
jgi:hypothetical protein